MDESTRSAIERLKRDPALAARILRSGDGNALLSALTKNDGGAALDRAAKAAAGGDTAELSRLLRGLMNDPNAAAAMGRLSESAKW